MPYVKMYEPAHDLLFQSEVSEETKKRALALIEGGDKYIAISDTPFDNLPILPRYRSQWPDELPPHTAGGS